MAMDDAALNNMYGQQPKGHWDMGSQGAAGSWSNGYNPQWEMDQTPAQQPLPAASPAPAASSPSPAYPDASATPPAKSPATAPAYSPPKAPANTPGWNPSPTGNYTSPYQEDSNPYKSVPYAALDGTGWKDDINPQMFQVMNPYYGQTGYYGNLSQVQAQMAGHAQSSEIPRSVLGSDYYTQSPVGQPLWQPQMTPQQQVQQDLDNWEANRWGPVESKFDSTKNAISGIYG